jgi:lysophospholipase L1-like esterase
MLKINIKKTLTESIIIALFAMIMLFCFGCQKEAPEPTDNIVFLGDSITSSYDLSRYFPEHPVINSGVWGDRTDNAEARLEDDVYTHNPKKVFILLGINDVGYGRDNEYVTVRIENIISAIQKELPYTQIYLISVYPTNVSDFETTHPFLSGDINDVVDNLNEMLKNLADDLSIEYLDIAQYLKNENNELKLEYTVDSLHLTDAAYELISSKLEKYLD